MVIQAKLYELGFYTAKIDGLNGPSTRRALVAYGEEKRVPGTLSDVARRMYRDARTSGRDPTKDELAAAQERIAQDLRDPEAARFRNARAYETPDGIAVCGEVNGKNLYGAYVGFQPYSVTFGKLRTTTRWLPDGKPFFVFHATFDQAGDFCAMGTTLALAILTGKG